MSRRTAGSDVRLDMPENSVWNQRQKRRWQRLRNLLRKENRRLSYERAAAGLLSVHGEQSSGILPDRWLKTNLAN